jgi:hypothetical protein
VVAALMLAALAMVVVSPTRLARLMLMNRREFHL